MGCEAVAEVDEDDREYEGCEAARCSYARHAEPRARAERGTMMGGEKG